MKLSRLPALLVLISTILCMSAAPAALAADQGDVARSAASATQTATPKPNIVLIYLDDTNPMDGRLWSNPAITPTLAEMFVTNGIHFPNAIGETPLCCPGRAGLLTGLHTHNHGVISNDVQLFHPEESLATGLQRAGYETMLLGKYLNKTHTLTPEQWLAHSAPWDVMDVFSNNPNTTSTGYTYDWSLFTKEGMIPTNTDTHSLRMITERTVARLQAAPADKPVFALLSTWSTHVPNIALPENIRDPRCASMPPWNPPNYNEADVSDKPPKVKALPLLPDPLGFSLVKQCEEMIGIDWMVSQVADELRNEGRFDDTVFIFTADNGMAWGEHRINDEKQWPYATPVPLYVSWPSQWAPRAITEYTSNIDIAPTLCDLAGCTLGPYPTGQLQPDGISILPLLNGSATALNRDALLEGNYQNRTWSAVRTTNHSPLGLWHYAEWPNGARELYDMANDPWELDNLAFDTSLGQLRTALALRLAALRQEGRVSVTALPDASIGLSEAGVLKQDNYYIGTPTKVQTQKIKNAQLNLTYEFYVRIQNDAQTVDIVKLRATELGTTRMTASYLVDGMDMSASIRSGTYQRQLLPGESFSVVALITLGPTTKPKSQKKILFTARSANDANVVDVVRGIVIRAPAGLTPPPPPPPI